MIGTVVVVDMYLCPLAVTWRKTDSCTQWSCIAIKKADDLSDRSRKWCVVQLAYLLVENIVACFQTGFPSCKLLAYFIKVSVFLR